MKNTALKQGNLLLAEPFMQDGNFQRTVLLLCQHGEEGSFGLVLNRPLDITLGDAIPDLDFFGARLHYGGPVGAESVMHYVHTRPDIIEGSILIKEGLYLGGNFDQVCDAIKSGQLERHEIRFYLGYSGWDVNQLEGEMEIESWIQSEVSADDVFTSDHDTLWKKVLQEMGGEYKMMSLYPMDPSYN